MNWKMQRMDGLGICGGEEYDICYFDIMIFYINVIFFVIL